jgi:3'(2'), 5'-bisphosphate nucleotidase
MASSSSYPREQAVAIAAVLKACQVAQATFQKLVNDETVTKKDKSPVTGGRHSLPQCSRDMLMDSLLAVADYAAQALVSTILAKHFPDIPLIGEEDAKDLNDPDQHSVRDKIVELANGAVVGDLATAEDQKIWDDLGKEARSTEQWLESIDRGNAQYSNKGRESSQQVSGPVR